MAKDDVRITITCDCGHSFEEGIAGVELDGYEFTCPACGHVDAFSPEQAHALVAQVEAAQAIALENARNVLGERFERATRGNQHVDYRRK